MKKKQFLSCLLAGIMLLQTPSLTSFAAAWEKENGVYVNASGGSIQGALSRGISVAKYQGEIDWQKVRADDISFAMVRLGYLNDEDPTFDANMKGAAANGVQVGLYLYSQALTVDTAIEEAKFSVKRALDYKVSYPIAIDLESKVLEDAGLGREEITAIANAFCKTVADAGYYPIIYVNHRWMTDYLDLSQIPYDIWYGRYRDLESYPEKATIWQSTDSGQIDGIVGNVCLEFAFTDYSSKIPANTWHNVDGKWYYAANYEKQTGWQWIGNAWYYLNPSDNGAMAANTTLTIGGVACSFQADGSWISNGQSTPPQATLTPSQISPNSFSPNGPASAQ